MDNNPPSAALVKGASTSFQGNLAYYKSKHRTRGCKITHMIGVPMIVLSLFFLPTNRKLFLQLQALGWLFQLIGHYVFERNKPVFIEVRSPFTAVSAVVFVSEEFKRLAMNEEL